MPKTFKIKNVVSELLRLVAGAVLLLVFVALASATMAMLIKIAVVAARWGWNFIR